MKVSITIIFLLLSYSFVFASEIDDLKTNDDVKRFLEKKVSQDLAYDFPKKIKDTTVFGNNNFYKIDLDNNGLTDLVIYGTYLTAIVDLGKGKNINRYKSYFIANAQLKKIIYEDKNALLVVGDYDKEQYYYRYNKMGIDINEVRDTLVLKFGAFIEYNPKPNQLKIEEVYIGGTTYFFSSDYEMLIKVNRKATASRIKYKSKYDEKLKKSITRDRLKIFKAKIDKKTYNNLINTINYILPFRNTYGPELLDTDDVLLRIRFIDGETVSIINPTSHGNYGLKAIYKQLNDLHVNQEWENHFLEVWFNKKQIIKTIKNRKYPKEEEYEDKEEDDDIK